MKKTVLVYVSILVGLFIFMSLLDRNSDYVIEQRLWEVHKKYDKIQQDPTVVPDKAFDEVAAEYERIIEQYPDSKVIQGVHLLVGEVYAFKKDFEKARERYKEAIEKYSDNREFAAEAMTRIGRSFEMEGDWAGALKVYRQILQDDPFTLAGLGTPIYIANYYRAENNFAKTMESYESAIIFYKNAAIENADSAVEFTALRYLANCYLDQNRWQDAIDTLGEVLLKFPTSNYLNAQRADMITKTINIVAAYKLNDFNVAIDLYQEFINKHPDHPLSAHLKKMIDAFKQLEEKGIEFTSQQ